MNSNCRYLQTNGPESLNRTFIEQIKVENMFDFVVQNKIKINQSNKSFLLEAIPSL